MLPSLATKQGTDEWRSARCGFVTSSRIGDVTAKVKSGKEPAASRVKYCIEKVVERLTGVPQDNGFISAAMADGIKTEPEARDTYAMYADCEVTEVGFIKHPKIDWCGGSPDGIVGGDHPGLIEIKCPEGPQHWRTVRYNEIKTEYISQCQLNMAITGTAFTDFVSYNPRFPVRHRLKIIRINRSAEAIAILEFEVKKFLAEVEAELQWEATKCDGTQRD
jgi:exodeoxyribonuclease (lambda-induced)